MDMAMSMEPVHGIREFVDALARLEAGQEAPYPFYCVLLCTAAEGLDAELSAFVDKHWEELDAMTDTNCLVFVVGKGPCADPDRQFAPKDVYRIAEHLGVRSSALPCAAFFSRPDQSPDVLRVRLETFLRGGPVEGKMITRFRGLATALNRCAGIRDEGDRLERLREALLEEHGWWNHRTTTTGEKLDVAASTAGVIEKVLAVGATVGGTLLKALGIGF
jgi:hypothetical protein